MGVQSVLSLDRQEGGQRGELGARHRTIAVRTERGIPVPGFSGTLNHFTSKLRGFGNREHPNRPQQCALRVLSIQQDESLATTVCGLIAEHSAALPERSLVIECPRNPDRERARLTERDRRPGGLAILTSLAIGHINTADGYLLNVYHFGPFFYLTACH